jgi:Arc/MetJ family transcription regulator
VAQCAIHQPCPWLDVAWHGLVPVVVGSPFGSPVSLAPLTFSKQERQPELATPRHGDPGATASIIVAARRSGVARAARITASVYPVRHLWDILLGREVEMAKTLIDVDEEYLAAAQQALHTETKKDTVNAALRTVAALAARRRDLQRLVTGGLPDLEDEQVMRSAWQR